MNARAFQVAALLLVLALPARAQAQTGSQKAAFVDALGRFSLAIDGRLGDEGPAALAALDDMQRALDAWDALIRSYENARDADRNGAPPALAARMHRAIAGVYLERGRFADAIRELEAARTIEPAAAETHALLAVAYTRVGNRTGAVAAARRAATSTAGDPVRGYLAGRALDRVGDPDGERLLRTFVAGERVPAAAPFVDLELVPERTDVEPYVPLVRYAGAFARLHAGDYRAAIAQLKAAASTDPIVAQRSSAPDDAVGRAASALRSGNVEDARRELTALLQREPDRVDALGLLGFADAAEGRYDHAVDSLRRAVSRVPADERAHVALLETLVDADRLTEADAAVAAALQALPTSGRARYLRGRLHQRQGRYREATADLEAVAALRPLLGLNGVLDTIGDLAAAQQDFAAAVDAYQRRVDVQPNEASAHADLGRAFMRLNRHPQALAEFVVAVMLDPSDAASHTAMAQIHLRDGEFPAAAAAARAALGLDAGSIEARYVLATALIRGGDTGEGHRELARYQQLQAEDTAARERVFEQERLKREATVAAAAGNHETVVDRRRRVVALLPQSGVARFELGASLVDAGRFAEAVDVLLSAIPLGAPVDVHVRLAAAYQALGRTDDSRRARGDYERLRTDALRARVRR